MLSALLAKDTSTQSDANVNDVNNDDNRSSSSSSIPMARRKVKKRVTFGDETSVILFNSNEDDQEPQETPTSPSTDETRGDRSPIPMSSSLPSKSSLTLLLEMSSDKEKAPNKTNFDDGGAKTVKSNVASNEIQQQQQQQQRRSYRDIKQRYFQSLGLQRQQQQQRMMKIMASPTRRRAVSEATPGHTSPHRQQRPGIPIPTNRSPTLMPEQHQRRIENALLDSTGTDNGGGIPINGTGRPIPAKEGDRGAIPRRTHSDDMASTFGVSLSVRKHVRYLDEYEEANSRRSVEDDEFLPPHILAERDRSDFSVYQLNKTRGQIRKMQIFEAL